MLLLLVLVCLIPRAVMAWKVDTLCEDGAVYIEAARHLERGDYDQAFHGTILGLNLYPVILMVLHRLGLEWLLAGKLWGTLLSTLVVLPMFGWARRQFNDRIAALGCLLYSVQPALLEQSPEVLRCPTYWLLLVAAMHFLWRAATEVRLAFFLMAGLFFALAVHTRIEAWLLLIPWAGWTLVRLMSLEQYRLRLAAFSLAGVAMLPMVVVLINVTWLSDHGKWEFCLADRFRVLGQLLLPLASDSEAAVKVVPTAVPVPTPATTVDQPPASTTDALPTAPPSASVLATPTAEVPAANPAAHPANPPPRRNRGLVWTYVCKLVDAFDPFFGLLTLVGIAYTWRMFIRPDQQAVFLVSLCCLAAIWLFWLQVRELNSRYFFTIVLMSTSYAAIGLLFMARTVSRLLAMCAAPVPNGMMATLLLAIVVAFGLTDACSNRYDSRHQRRDLGLWVLRNFGPGQSILGNQRSSRIVAHYAEARYYGPAAEEIGGAIYRWMLETYPPCVVLIDDESQSSGADAWLARFRALDASSRRFQRVDVDTLPAGCQHLTILAGTRQELARKP
jgi:hypothetical protein